MSILPKASNATLESFGLTTGRRRETHKGPATFAMPFATTSGDAMADDPSSDTGSVTAPKKLAARYRATAAAVRGRARAKGELTGQALEAAAKYEVLARCVEDLAERPRPDPTDRRSW
jgi:hypothetical protein